MKKNTFKRKIRNSILCMASFAIVFSLGGAVRAEKFKDMPNNWSRDALEKAIENNLIRGDNGRIRPDDSLTRAEMAAIINRAFGVEVKTNLDSFTDLDREAWYYDEMAKAVAMGTFKGSGGKLNPEEPISRQEAFIVIARALNLEGIQWRPGEIRDLNQVHTWARGGVFALLYEGYISGSDGRINPRGEITRAEFAQLMDNVIKKYIREPGEIRGDIEGNILVTSPGVRISDSNINGDVIISENIGNDKLELMNTHSHRIVIRSGSWDNLDINGVYSSMILSTEEFKDYLDKTYMIPIPDLPSGAKYLDKNNEYGTTTYNYSYNKSLSGGGSIEKVSIIEYSHRNYISIVGKDINGRVFSVTMSPDNRNQINYSSLGAKPEFGKGGLSEILENGRIFMDHRNW